MGTYAVTGAASGICAAVTDRLKREGHRVIGIDVQPTDIVADLGTAAGRSEAAARVAEMAGGSLDGVVSGAGLGPYCDPEPVLRVNFFGALAILDDLMPLLRRGTEPSAVAISSIGAIYADVLPELDFPDCIEACMRGDEEAAVAAIQGHTGNDSYCVAKRALAYKVREYATSWGEAGIRLNALAPGSTETPMLDKIFETPEIGDAVRQMPIPIGRSAPPEELASVICFLLGRDARFVHGAMIHADGGSDCIVRPRHL
jgi:NAD(P)-dependent dehydrogenase (short-subunit alcohol dehydrogenase family)